jgi:hypothetical protein
MPSNQIKTSVIYANPSIGHFMIPNKESPLVYLQLNSVNRDFVEMKFNQRLAH